VTQTKADLSATIRAGFRPTSYRFEYGPTGAYGSSIGGDAGSGNDPRSVGGTVSGLQPGTTYHFRVSATNAVGTELSADRTFTTAPATAAPPPPRKRCKRGFVRVSPVSAGIDCHRRSARYAALPRGRRVGKRQP
jgi:hypothetical protein